MSKFLEKVADILIYLEAHFKINKVMDKNQNFTYTSSPDYLNLFAGNKYLCSIDINGNIVYIQNSTAPK